MAAEKLLAEWFWVDRWMGSSAFGLPLEARGLYREMLSQAWRRGASLPNDHDQIQRFVGVTRQEWKRTWPYVERFWKVSGAFLVNDTQIEVYNEAQGRAERASRKGQAGAHARHKRQSGDARGLASVSVSDHQIQEPPVVPLSGGRAPTRKELKEAQTILNQRFGQCRHEPECAHQSSCLITIVLERRVKSGAA